MTSGSTSSAAWESPARTGRSRRRPMMSSVFICNRRVSSEGTGARPQLARPTHHLISNLFLGELDRVVDACFKCPLPIAAHFDRPGWVNHLQHPGKILSMADSDRRRCAALVRSSYVPGSVRDMADGGSLQHCRCPDRRGSQASQASLGRQEAA